MNVIDTQAIASDPLARLEFLESFMGYTEDDRKTVAESAAVLSPALPQLLDAIYDHLLSFDDTKRIFLGSRGDVAPEYIELRKEHLTEWVLKVVGTEDKRELAAYLVQVGKAHTGVAGEPGRVVPPRYMIGLTAFVMTAIWSALFDGLKDDTAKIKSIGLAWHKFMQIQLEMFLSVLAPHFPEWDR